MGLGFIKRNSEAVVDECTLHLWKVMSSKGKLMTTQGFSSRYICALLYHFLQSWKGSFYSIHYGSTGHIWLLSAWNVATVIEELNFLFCFVLFLFLINFIYLFIYFWLHWVFVAALRLSLVAVSGGYSSLRCAGFSLWWLLLLWSTGSRCAGFSSCGTQAQ